MNWTPKYGGLQTAAQSSIGTMNAPQVDLPQVGDTILISARPYGHHIIGEDSEVPNGTDVIEVEVKAIKKAKLTIE